MNDLLKENRVEEIEGTIVGFRASRDSGIAHLVVDGVHVPCDNVATVNFLHACFGNFIVDGHACDINAIIGKRIRYTLDEIGVLKGMIPIASGANEVN